MPPRRSDADTLLLPLAGREVAFASALFKRLSIEAEFAKAEPPRPDVIATARNGTRIGVELTQPELIDQPSDIARIMARIEGAALARRSDAYDRDETIITIEFRSERKNGSGQPTILATDFKREFEAGCFVMHVTQLLNECLRASTVRPRSFDVFFDCDSSTASELAVSITPFDGEYLRLTLPNSYAAFRLCPPIRAAYVVAASDPISTPYVHVDWSYGWGEREIQLNWKQIEEAISGKIETYQRNGYSEETCDELWLVIHYPVFGSLSFHAGKLDGRRIGFERIRGCCFDRIFLLGDGHAFELSFNDREFRRVVTMSSAS